LGVSALYSLNFDLAQKYLKLNERITSFMVFSGGISSLIIPAIIGYFIETNPQIIIYTIIACLIFNIIIFNINIKRKFIKYLFFKQTFL